MKAKKHKKFVGLNIKKLLLFLLVLGLGIVGAKLTYIPQPKQAPLMIHEYVIEHSDILCKDHDGLHYIVPVPSIVMRDKYNSELCEDTYKIRCQDDTLFTYNTGSSYCGIKIIQYDETMKNAGVEVIL